MTIDGNTCIGSLLENGKKEDIRNSNSSFRNQSSKTLLVLKLWIIIQSA